MCSPMVVQKPGAVVHAASSPASPRPATSPWASASPQCSTRRRRPARAWSGDGAVADGEHGGVRAAHRGVHEHGAVDVESGGGRQVDPRGHAGAEDHEVGGQRLAALQRHAPARLDALDLGAEADLDARLAEQRRDEVAGALSQALGLRALLGRDEDDLEAAPYERRRRLAGDEAGADDHRASAGRRGGAQAQGVVHRADRVQPRVLRAVDGRALGLGARWPARRRRRPAAGRRRGGPRAPARSSATTRRAAAQRHGVGREPRLVLERQVGRLELAAQELLGQRRALVGEVGLGADEVDGRLAARLAIAARGAQRGRASPDDDDPLVGPHASKTSMRNWSLTSDATCPRASRSRRRAWTTSPVSGSMLDGGR